jgi:hypothetical protein
VAAVRPDLGGAARPRRRGGAAVWWIPAWELHGIERLREAPAASKERRTHGGFRPDERGAPASSEMGAAAGLLPVGGGAPMGDSGAARQFHGRRQSGWRRRCKRIRLGWGLPRSLSSNALWARRIERLRIRGSERCSPGEEQRFPLKKPSSRDQLAHLAVRTNSDHFSMTLLRMTDARSVGNKLWANINTIPN